MIDDKQFRIHNFKAKYHIYNFTSFVIMLFVFILFSVGLFGLILVNIIQDIINLFLGIPVDLNIYNRELIETKEIVRQQTTLQFLGQKLFELTVALLIAILIYLIFWKIFKGSFEKPESKLTFKENKAIYDFILKHKQDLTKDESVLIVLFDDLERYIAKFDY